MFFNSSILINLLKTCLLVWPFPQSPRLRVTYCSKLSLLLASCFLFICMVDPTQMCPSSVSPLRLFHGIICFLERLKGGTWELWITGGRNLDWRGREGGLIWKGDLRPLFIPCVTYQENNGQEQLRRMFYDPHKNNIRIFIDSKEH